MYLKKNKKTRSGRIHLSIVDTYYDKTRGHSRTKTIESIGYLDELEKQYDDPISFFTKHAEQLNAKKRN